MTDRHFLYRGIAFLSLFFYFLLFFVDPKSHQTQTIIDFISGILLFSTVAFTTFWLQRKALIASLLLYALKFNADLYTHKATRWTESEDLLSFFSLASLVLSGMGFLFFTLGFWDNLPFKFLRQEKELRELTLIIIIIIFSLIVQLVPWLI